MARKIVSNLCRHEFTYGYCPKGCVWGALYYDEYYELQKVKLAKMFKKREMRNPITKHSFAAKLRLLEAAKNRKFIITVTK